MEGYEKIKSGFKNYSEEYGTRIIRATCDLFKREVVKRVEELGYKYSNSLIVTSKKPINIREIRDTITDTFDETTLRRAMIIENCKSHYHGAEQERMMVKFLGGHLQEKDMSSNSVSKNTLEGQALPITSQKSHGKSESGGKSQRF